MKYFLKRNSLSFITLKKIQDPNKDKGLHNGDSSHFQRNKKGMEQKFSTTQCQVQHVRLSYSCFLKQT